MTNREHAMRILKLCVGAAIAMALVAAGFAHADENAAGTTAANFLSIGTNPRLLSMGGAGLGIGNEIGSVSWNAAALGWAGPTEMVISHAGMNNESAQEWAAVGGRFGEGQTRWSLSGLYQGDGSFEGRDASNNPTGSFGASSIAIGAHLAHQFSGLVTVGFGAKSVNEKLGDVTGSGFTFDAGVQVRKSWFGAGVAVQNLLGQMKYGTAIYDFPTNYGAGLGLEVPGTGLRFALDANFPSNYYKDVRTGLEWTWHDMVAVRAGYRSELGSSEDPLTGPTFGLGAGKNGFWMDYAYLLSSNGEGQHRVGLKISPTSWAMGGLTPLGHQEGRAPAGSKADAKANLAAAKPKAEARPKREAPPVASTTKPAARAPEVEKTSDAAKTTSLQGVMASALDATPKSVAPPVAAPPATPVQAPPAQTPALAPTQTPSPAPPPAAPAPPAPAAPAVQEAPKPAPPVQAEAPKPQDTAADEPRPDKIKVKDGETLASIARRWDTSAPAIMMLNNMVSEQVKPGQVLKLPAKGRY
jgi:hypothetical protein